MIQRSSITRKQDRGTVDDAEHWGETVGKLQARNEETIADREHSKWITVCEGWQAIGDGG